VKGKEKEEGKPAKLKISDHLLRILTGCGKTNKLCRNFLEKNIEKCVDCVET